jgi:hypothetical protein
MAIRLPLTNIGTFTDTGDLGANSVAGVVPYQFQIPLDCDGVVVKLTSSIVGGTVSATLQTTDDGGTTWYDVARTPTVALAPNASAQWISAPVFGMGIKTTQLVAANSSVFGSVLASTGSTAASTLGAGQVSGLPILGQLGQVSLIYSGNVTSNALTQVKVLVSSQSASHN